MRWNVLLHDDFSLEFAALADPLQDELLAHALLLRDFGPGLWRVAFAFDPAREAILLIAGNKGGANQRRFYKRLIAVADERFDTHLKQLNTSTKEHEHGKKA